MIQREAHFATGNIVVVGPLFPFRGGISAYNRLLFDVLKRYGLTDMAVSFSRQYPAWLYPGKSDKEEGFENSKLDDVIYPLDSINPWTWWKTARDISSLRPSLVVFHWWTIFWAPCFAVLSHLLKRKGIRTAFICHNLEDHDSGRLKSWMSRRALGMADGFLTHSSDQKAALERQFPNRPVFYHPIPKFGNYPAAQGVLPKRGRLELLFFGFIRPYKGLDLLIEALDRLKDARVHLTVVGEPWGDMRDLQDFVKSRHLNVEFHLEYKRDDELGEFFHRADFVVLPYRHATGSAVASVAHHYNKPLLASCVGGLPDVVEHGRTGMLFEPNDVAAIADTIAMASREQAQVFSTEVEQFGKRWTWDSLVNMLAQLAATRGKETKDIRND